MSKIRSPHNPSPYKREVLEQPDVAEAKRVTDTPTVIIIPSEDGKNTPVSVVRQPNRTDPTFSQSETVPTTWYENESDTMRRRERFQRIVAKLTSKRNRVEVYSRTWTAWFPCVVRQHSQTTGTVVVVYHNGTDTVVKLLDPESPLIRIVEGPIYSIYCSSLEKMYSGLFAGIRAALQFYEVKTGGIFLKKGVHSCFSGRDLVMWLRTGYLEANVLEEDGVMAQLGGELLRRGIIWRVKPPQVRVRESASEVSLPKQDNATLLLATRTESKVEINFDPRADYMYALSEWSVITELIKKETKVVKQQEDRLFWTAKSHLEVFNSSTNTWELATVVSILDPWLLLVYAQEAQAAKAKWIHRLDVHKLRHPRRFWRTGSQIWVFSRGDNQWYAGVISNRETRGLVDHAVPKDEFTVNVMYGPTDSQGAFTRTKPLKVDSEHIRPRVARLSRMCIRVRSEKNLPLKKVEEIKRRFAAYSRYRDGQRPFHEAQPDLDSLILVCPNVQMTVQEREKESRLLSEALKCKVKVDVVPWELYTAGRDVLYNLPKPTSIS